MGIVLIISWDLIGGCKYDVDFQPFGHFDHPCFTFRRGLTPPNFNNPFPDSALTTARSSAGSIDSRNFAQSMACWSSESECFKVMTEKKQRTLPYCVLIDLDRAFKYSKLFFLVLISLLACILSAWSRKTHFWHAGAYMVVITWLHQCSNIDKTREHWNPFLMLPRTVWVTCKLLPWMPFGHHWMVSRCNFAQCLLPDNLRKWIRVPPPRLWLNSADVFFAYEKLMVRWSDCQPTQKCLIYFHMKFHHFFRLPHGFSLCFPWVFHDFPGLPGLSPAESELLEAILGVAEKVGWLGHGGNMGGKLGDVPSSWKIHRNIYIHI